MLIPMIKNYYNKYWDIKFSLIHSKLNIKQTAPHKLKLILGTGRSGTSWMGKVLSKSQTSLRFFNEYLYHVTPKLRFSFKKDHTAIPYCQSLDDNHPLIKSYKVLTHPDYDLNKFLPKHLKKLMLRNDKNFSICLIKEVHSLLATEALLDKFKCHAVIITRNPIYVVDSLLCFRPLNDYMWDNESKYITDNLFLNTYFPQNNTTIKKYIESNQGNKRQQIIMRKTLTVAVLNKMLEQIAKKFNFVLHIKYEDLCKNPQENFARAAEFLSLEFKGEMEKFLKKTMQKTKDSEKDHYSVFRDTKKQLNRPFKFLTRDEVREAKEMLINCEIFN